jgi:ribosomal protein L11 methyltransferase
MDSSSTQTELRLRIKDAFVEPLENHFYELVNCPWGIQQKEKGDPYFLFGYFPDQASAELAFSALHLAFPELSTDCEYALISDAEWQNAYKTFVTPWSNRQLHWIPLWERQNIQAPENAAVVYLDAGMAFGTGCHETTRLCARRLLDDWEQTLPAQRATRHVIDAGCGSGVLALSAVALGYRKVTAFDFDPDALSVCADNVRDNPHLPNCINFNVADLTRGLQHAKADLLLANIQTNVLLPEVETILQALHPLSTLALSGILRHELDAVEAAYAQAIANRFHLSPAIDRRIDGEWGDLCIRLGV